MCSTEKKFEASPPTLFDECKQRCRLGISGPSSPRSPAAFQAQDRVFEQRQIALNLLQRFQFERLFAKSNVVETSDDSARDGSNSVSVIQFKQSNSSRLRKLQWRLRFAASYSQVLD
jgi:hypothetical protein